MTKTYSQELHRIWSEVLRDPQVPASSVIMEAMERAHHSGYKLGDIVMGASHPVVETQR